MSDALEKLNKAVQEYINEVDEEGPVLVRGWALVTETMLLNDEGRAGYKTTPISGPDTSNVLTLGLLRHGADIISTCLLHHGDCE